MPVTDDQVAVLRAQLAGQMEEHMRLAEALVPPPLRSEYRTLVPAAFFVAVLHGFRDDNRQGQVIEFVAKVRSRSEQLADDVDPRIAERLILGVFDGDGEEIPDVTAWTEFRYQLVLLAAFVADQRLDDAELDGFLAKSRALADGWLQ